MWSWFDRRTGNRATVVAWPSERLAGEALGERWYYVYCRGGRPDCQESLQHLEVRAIPAVDDWLHR